MKKITLALVALFVMVGMSRADNWMKHLPDGEYVANVSLPGSHDSGTGNGCGRVLNLVDGTQYAKTQDLTISEQWAIGIRAYDLRPCVTSNGYMNVNHGIVPTSLGFEEAMTTLRDSLIANPSEFIVIHLLHETDGEMFYSSGADQYEGLLHSILESDDMKDYIVDFSRDLTVGDMRGKILILYRDSYEENPVGGMMTNWAGYIDWSAQTNGRITGGGNGAGTLNTSTLYMQDQSNTSAEGMLTVKVDAVNQMLDYTTTHYYTTPSSIVWVYNFASAYSLMENISILTYSFDVSLAAGYGDNATYTNKAIIDFLADQPGPTGIILADYVGVDETTITTTEGGLFGIGGTTVETKYDVLGKTLIESIIANNWTYIEYQPANDAEGVQITIEHAEEKDITTNVSDSDPFLIPLSYADAITEAIAAATALLANEENPSEEECEAAINAIDEAIEAFDNSPLNAPQEGDLFNIILSADGYRYDGYAVTFYTGAYPDAGDYGLQFTSDIDPIYGQAFTFTPSDAMQDGYVISFTGVEGETHYLCNGTLYGGNKAQIRTTTEADDAYTYQVILQRDAVGLWYLYSEENGTYVGSNGSSSLYASDNYPNLQLVATEGVKVDVEIADEWGTLILPFAAAVPEGMTVYSCAATEEEEGEVALTEETTIVANTPYIVSGTGTYIFEGTGAYYSDYSLMAGLLTGTILGSAVPKGAYVLADQGEGQAFYIVTEDGTTLLPYTCYLSIETSGDGAEPRTFYNLPGGTVAVKAIEADAANAANTLYDLQGRQVTNPRHGIYIRGGEKILVK